MLARARLKWDLSDTCTRDVVTKTAYDMLHIPAKKAAH